MESCNIRVTKEFTFEAAHALYKYDGPCKNIHGHSYLLSVSFLGKVQSSPGEAKDGMVVDFSDIKRIVQSKVISKYDHALLLNVKTSSRLVEILQSNYDKIVILDKQPTCEYMLTEIVRSLQESAPNTLKLVKVCLRETTTSYAEWLDSDN